jgi:hypothetical protein
MKQYLLLLFCAISYFSVAQQNEKLSTVDFVEIINNNTEEALFYYQNNWQQLREKAVTEGYIQSYQMLQTEHTPEAPYHLILITTYANKTQYDAREPHFNEIIAASGGLKLLNDKKPTSFRKVRYGKDEVKHLY